MILGLSVADFTLLHVIISLIGIASGLIVLAFMMRGIHSKNWTALFLASTVLTSVTGFFFHSTSIGPPHVVGVISLIVLAACLAALYVYKLANRWRGIYVVTAVIALYLNCFVGVVQSFQKVAALHAMAPTQSEPPFLMAQGITLALMAAGGFVAVKKFRAES